MGVVEVLERAYGEDYREGIAMWSALLYAARSREAAKQENTEEIPDTVPAAVPACERTTTIWKTYMKTEIIKISTRRRMNRRKGGKRPSSYFIYFRWAARFLLWKAALTTLAAAMLLSEIAQGVPVQQRDRAAPCPAPARSARIRRKAAPAYFLYQWQL